MVGVGGSGQQMKALPVRVEMEGKRVLTGDLIIAHVKTLNEALNDTKSFLEFSTPEGSLQFISKKSIVHIETFDATKEDKKDDKKTKSQNEGQEPKGQEPEDKAETEEKTENLDNLNIDDIKDPFAFLGIGADAYDVEVKHAYHELAKQYHPDIFSNQDLPSEVMEYMMTKSQMINTAYAEVCRIKEEKALADANEKGYSL